MIAATVTLVHAQDQKKDDRPILTLTGCIDGNWLHVRSADQRAATRYRLRGSKQMLKELSANYKNHRVEVVGAVTDMGATTHRGKTIKVGKKTTILTGAKEAPDVPSGMADPELEVLSFKDLNNACSK